MWEPDPSWRQLPGASGPSTQGIWLAESEGRRWVVKRLSAPDPRATKNATTSTGPISNPLTPAAALASQRGCRGMSRSSGRNRRA